MNTKMYSFDHSHYDLFIIMIHKLSYIYKLHKLSKLKK